MEGLWEKMFFMSAFGETLFGPFDIRSTWYTAGFLVLIGVGYLDWYFARLLALLTKLIYVVGNDLSYLR